MMRWSVLVSATLAANSLAGCQTINDVASSVTGSGSPSAPQAEEAAAPAAAAPAGSAGAAPRATSSGIGLAGLTADELRAAWGEPVLKRNESGSELWQYGGRDCALLVYLYPSSGSRMSVSHAEAVPGGANEAAVAACAKGLGKPPLKPIS